MLHMVDNFVPQGGKHCITNALKQLFAFHGCPLSEDMLFGLGAGLSFVYVNTPAMPMVNGRSRVFDFEKLLAQRLGVSISCHQPKDSEIAREKALKLLKCSQPVLVYVDMPFLSYLHLAPDSHFGGHAVVLAGFDDEKQVFFISDRDNHDYPIRTPEGDICEDLHAVSFDALEQARGSSFRPFPAKNKYLEVDLSGFRGVTPEMLKTAISEVCDSMLNPPAKLCGISGIEKFSKEIKKWNKFQPELLKRSGIGNYFMINGDGGTGGGMFRGMFGGFLCEAAALTSLNELTEVGNCFKVLAARWDGLADDLWTLGETGDTGLLSDMSAKILDMADTERQLLMRTQTLIG